VFPALFLSLVSDTNHHLTSCVSEGIVPEQTTEPVTWAAVETSEEAYQPPLFVASTNEGGGVGVGVGGDSLEDEEGGRGGDENLDEKIVREIHDPLGIFSQRELTAVIKVWVKTQEQLQLQKQQLQNPLNVYMPISSTSLSSSSSHQLSSSTVNSSMLYSSGAASAASLDKDVSVKFNALREGFDVALFLEVIHKKTSPSDLKTSLQKIRNLFDLQTKQLKNLVEQNFERFVSCKDTIDGISHLISSHLIFLTLLSLTCFSSLQRFTNKLGTVNLQEMTWEQLV
jgi:hypothetical protein